jgi:hypothetical protein
MGEARWRRPRRRFIQAGGAGGWAAGMWPLACFVAGPLGVGICSGPVSKPTKYRAMLGLAQRAEMAVEPGTLVGPS